MSDFTDHIEYKIAIVLWKSFPPIYLVLGTFGNVLTVVILMQRKSRQSSTAIYLTALAVSDLVILWAGLLTQWIGYVSETQLEDQSAFLCKSRLFLVYTGFQCSSWFLVAVTLERFISVWFPHKVKLICTLRNSFAIIIILTAFFMLLNVHWFYGYNITSYTIDNETTGIICARIDAESYTTFIDIWDWSDLCLVALIPLCLLTIANSSIVYHIIKRRTTIKNRIAPSDGTTATQRKVPQLTTMLVTVNIVFVVCSTPILIFILRRPFSNNDMMTSQEIATADLWWAVVNLLAYLNTTLNFILYFLSGSKFRREVKVFFLRNKSSFA